MFFGTQCINKLLHRNSSSPLPTCTSASALADSLASFFTDKISKLRLSLTNSSSTSSSPHSHSSRVVVLVLVLVLKDKFKVLVLVLGAQVQVLVLVLEEKSLVVSLFLVFFRGIYKDVFCETRFHTHITCDILLT